MLSRSDGFMLYCKLGVDFFTISEVLYPNMKITLRLIRAISNFYVISDNPNVSFGIVDCSLYTRCIVLTDQYQKKTKDMRAFTPLEFNYMETLAKTFINPARQNQFNQRNIVVKALCCRIAIATNKNSAFMGSYTESPFWYQQFDPRQIRTLRRDHRIVDFDAADIYRLHVTTVKAMNSLDGIHSIPVKNSEDQYVLVFDLTPMQDATAKCQQPELVGEPLRLELNFTFSLEHVVELIELGERMSAVAVDKFDVIGRNI